jgi:arsenate reductase (thioredoxin)
MDVNSKTMSENLPTILVLCTGNSCRSQIAEGYLKHYAGDRFNVLSAGTDPTEHVNPFAIRVMAEEGIDLSGGRPKHVKEFLGRISVRYLIVVCDGANESCPRIFPGMSERLYWPFDDPAPFQGSEQETLMEFRRVRDQIKQQILTWLTTEGEKI